jgi:hypothetical protein
MIMRSLTNEEKMLISAFAGRLGEGERQQLLEDMGNATAEWVVPDRSRVLFEIAGYERPPYRGQHVLVEGRMFDSDGAELSVLLHGDENSRLLELEFIRWGSDDLQGPRWDTLKLHA